MQKKLTVLFTFATFVLLVAWAVTPAQAHTKFCNSDPEHKHCNDDPSPPGGGGNDQYSVKVTFHDSDCDTTVDDRDRFCSDTKGYYIDGMDGVVAVGDKFRFSLNTQTGSPRRSFLLNFSDNCAPGAECVFKPMLSAGLTTSGADVFSTGHFDDSGFSLLDMGEGIVPIMLPRNLAISFKDDEGDSWVLSFNPNYCDSNWVNVTRTRATNGDLEDTWDFEPDTDDHLVKTACLERRKNGKSGPLILQGRYIVPFKFTVTLL